MKKKQAPEEIETFTIGPSCCGNFSGSKDLCHQCVASGIFHKAICFARPDRPKGTDYEQQREQLRALAELTGG